MSYKFNIFTGTFDIVESGSGPSPTQTPNYVQTFNATTDWGSPVNGYYTITIPLANHAKGNNPVIQVFELIGSDYDIVDTTIFIDMGTSAISIKSLENPDSRFQGKVVISENN